MISVLKRQQPRLAVRARAGRNRAARCGEAGVNFDRAIDFRVPAETILGATTPFEAACTPRFGISHDVAQRIGEARDHRFDSVRSNRTAYGLVDNLGRPAERHGDNRARRRHRFKQHRAARLANRGQTQNVRRTHRSGDLIELTCTREIYDVGKAKPRGFSTPGRGHRTVADHVEPDRESEFGAHARDRFQQHREPFERHQPADEKHAQRRERVRRRRPRRRLEPAQVNAVLKHRDTARAISPRDARQSGASRNQNRGRMANRARTRARDSREPAQPINPRRVVAQDCVEAGRSAESAVERSDHQRRTQPMKPRRRQRSDGRDRVDDIETLAGGGAALEDSQGRVLVNEEVERGEHECAMLTFWKKPFRHSIKRPGEPFGVDENNFGAGQRRARIGERGAIARMGHQRHRHLS